MDVQHEQCDTRDARDKHAGKVFAELDDFACKLAAGFPNDNQPLVDPGVKVPDWALGLCGDVGVDKPDDKLEGLPRPADVVHTLAAGRPNENQLPRDHGVDVRDDQNNEEFAQFPSETDQKARNAEQYANQELDFGRQSVSNEVDYEKQDAVDPRESLDFVTIKVPVDIFANGAPHVLKNKVTCEDRRKRDNLMVREWR